MNKILATLLLLLTTQAQAGQFEQFIISPYTNMGDTSNYGGIIYFDGSFEYMPKDYICNQRKLHPNQLQMTDQEGGSVVRYKQPENTPPSANKATQLGLDKFTSIMNDVSKSFAKTCINTNLAPIADTDREAKIIRSYSENPSEVNQYASIFATSMRNNGITPTWKHFPGLSSEVENMKKNDSHFKANFKDDFKEALIDTSSKADIEKNMQSFKNNNYDLLMVNSAIFTSYGNTPSILNQEIINQAKTIQPNSLIISDDISFLKLNEEQVLFIFRNVDYIMFTDYRNSVVFINELEKLKDKKLITQHDIYEKQNKINKWRNNHK